MRYGFRKKSLDERGPGEAPQPAAKPGHPHAPPLATRRLVVEPAGTDTDITPFFFNDTDANPRRRRHSRYGGAPVSAIPAISKPRWPIALRQGTENARPANIYRFFDSKKSIHEDMARRLMNEVEDGGGPIAAKTRAAPAERLRRIAGDRQHRMNAERFVGDAKIHEMARPSR